MSIVRNIAGVAKGMSITFREMLNPTEVENYPDGPGPNRGAHFQDRFRGAHVLQRDENGLEKCVACFLCAAACPANCIYIEAAENTAERRISSAERYAKVYNIDYNRCKNGSFSGTAWKPVPRTLLLTDTASNSPRSMPRLSSIARKTCWLPPSGCQIASVPTRAR